MILLDSTVVITSLKTRGPRFRLLFASLNPVVSGVTRAEVLHGARDLAELASLQRTLDQFQQMAVPADIWDELGRNLCTLRLRGLIVPFPDALIATLAIPGRMELWTYDKHFQMIQSVLTALKLFAEPP